MDELGLTPAQLDCARVIHELAVLKGHAPSYAEIMAEMDLASRGRVAYLVYALRDRGWLTMAPPPLDERPFEITPDGEKEAAAA